MSHQPENIFAGTQVVSLVEVLVRVRFKSSRSEAK